MPNTTLLATTLESSLEWSCIDIKKEFILTVCQDPRITPKLANFVFESHKALPLEVKISPNFNTLDWVKELISS